MKRLEGMTLYLCLIDTTVVHSCTYHIYRNGEFFIVAGSLAEALLFKAAGDEVREIQTVEATRIL